VEEDVAVLLTFETRRFARVYIRAIYSVVPELNTTQ
jgi:hypothetical protein